MRLLRFFGREVWTTLGFLLEVVRTIAQELFQLARGLLVFAPMLAVGLMIFMFFQVNLTLEQMDVFGLLIVAFVGGWATGMIMRGKVDGFWKKD